MRTNEFIAKLRAAPGNRLLFVDRDGNAIHAGYHLTELKAASFQTVDCGCQLNNWTETIVQLWVPPDADDGYMTVGKFLQIFDKVRGISPLDLAAEIRIEYGDENFFPSTYHIESVTRDQHSTRVLLVSPATTCKARNRCVRRAGSEREPSRVRAGSCC
jgi:Family of unknown function (DUF6428)